MTRDKRFVQKLRECDFFEEERGGHKKVWMSTWQASWWYNIHERTVRKWIASGRIKNNDVVYGPRGYLVRVAY